jgi:hypothetical protein
VGREEPQECNGSLCEHYRGVHVPKLWIAVAHVKKNSHISNRLSAEFEALGGGALTKALAQEAEPGTPCARAGSYTSGSASQRPARSIAQKS